MSRLGSLCWALYVPSFPVKRESGSVNGDRWEVLMCLLCPGNDTRRWSPRVDLGVGVEVPGRGPLGVVWLCTR